MSAVGTVSVAIMIGKSGDSPVDANKSLSSSASAKKAGDGLDVLGAGTDRRAAVAGIIDLDCSAGGLTMSSEFRFGDASKTVSFLM